ncbi:hypothetical protein NQF86_04850 [Bombella sp. TMW 2.2543]|uniref:Uncharacterized protein n=1 Tax=Bombella pluederhausensis TaxID=2967336 RepID=A0ABT3WFY8_9PROT|nr:hypothetical protein [Bombella pluederhausensis]MCX5617991.1 hypothetical protein [Bombella pluederhausensis]
MSWDELYLETCCRSALHRLVLSGKVGRPVGPPPEGRMLDFRAPLKDRSCLMRMEGMGLAHQRDDGRFEVTQAGEQRHDREILSMKRARHRRR